MVLCEDQPPVARSEASSVRLDEGDCEAPRWDGDKKAGEDCVSAWKAIGLYLTGRDLVDEFCCAQITPLAVNARPKLGDTEYIIVKQSDILAVVE